MVHWCGGNALTVGLLGFMDMAKVQRADEGLARALAGELTERELRALGGLLYHFVFTIALPPYVMYHFYDGIDQLRRGPVMVYALFLCGGPTREGPDDLVTMGSAMGVVVENWDIANGGRFNLLVPATQDHLVTLLGRGGFDLVYGSPLCRSYSIEHQPRLRTWWEPRGSQPVPPEWQVYLDKDTSLARFVVKCLGVADDAGKLWGLEHPSPRWDARSHAHWPEHTEQGTIFDDPDTLALASRPTAAYFDHAQCKVGSPFQKYTRQLGHHVFVHFLSPRLYGGHKCTCAWHEKVAIGQNADGSYVSAESASYPPRMKKAILSSARDAARALRNAESPADVDVGNASCPVPVTARSHKAMTQWRVMGAT